VGNFFVECRADALDDAAPDLAFDHHRIDHGSAVLRDRIVEDLDSAGRGIDGDHGGVGYERELAGVDSRLIGAGDGQKRLDAVAKRLHAQLRRPGDVLEAGAT